MDGSFTLPLESRRLERVEMAQALVGAVSSFNLALAGVQQLSGHGALVTVLGVIEMAVAIALLPATVATVRRRRPVGGIGWIDLLGGVVMLAAGGSRGLVQPAQGVSWALLVNGVVAIAVGLFAERIAERRRRRRVLTIDATGIRWRLRRLRSVAMGWDQIAAVEASGTDLTFRLADGRQRRLRLADLRNGDEVAAQVLRRAEQQGVVGGS